MEKEEKAGKKRKEKKIKDLSYQRTVCFFMYAKRRQVDRYELQIKKKKEEIKKKKGEKKKKKLLIRSVTTGNKIYKANHYRDAATIP